MKELVEERLATALKFGCAMDKNNATNNPTFDNLRHVVKNSKEKDKTTTFTADRNVRQLLFIAFEDFGKVYLHSVLKYELMPMPLAFAEMNGSLRNLC